MSAISALTKLGLAVSPFALAFAANAQTLPGLTGPILVGGPGTVCTTGCDDPVIIPPDDEEPTTPGNNNNNTNTNTSTSTSNSSSNATGGAGGNSDVTIGPVTNTNNAAGGNANIGNVGSNVNFGSGAVAGGQGGAGGAGGAGGNVGDVTVGGSSATGGNATGGYSGGNSLSNGGNSLTGGNNTSNTTIGPVGSTSSATGGTSNSGGNTLNNGSNSGGNTLSNGSSSTSQGGSVSGVSSSSQGGSSSSTSTNAGNTVSGNSTQVGGQSLSISSVYKQVRQNPGTAPVYNVVRCTGNVQISTPVASGGVNTRWENCEASDNGMQLVRESRYEEDCNKEWLKARIGYAFMEAGNKAQAKALAKIGGIPTKAEWCATNVSVGYSSYQPPADVQPVQVEAGRVQQQTRLPAPEQK